MQLHKFLIFLRYLFWLNSTMKLGEFGIKHYKLIYLFLGVCTCRLKLSYLFRDAKYIIDRAKHPRVFFRFPEPQSEPYPAITSSPFIPANLSIHLQQNWHNELKPGLSLSGSINCLDWLSRSVNRSWFHANQLYIHEEIWI